MLAILQDGFPGHQVQPGYLAGKINAAITRYGLRVMEGPTLGTLGQT